MREKAGKKSLTVFLEASPCLLSDSVALSVTREIVLFLVVLRVRENRVIVVVGLVFRFPSHFVLLFEAPPRVREPSGHLRQCHLRDDRQHNLLTLGRVRVLLVLVQPGFQRRCGLPRRVLPPCRQVVSGAISAKIISYLVNRRHYNVRENLTFKARLDFLHLLCNRFFLHIKVLYIVK